eukprot:CAMPEP_0172551208 /NCGR_PEP_ID=MMETSP1067-20121228/36683_1 /TAXON_ID=265564 ORGANISM="Thalassiosira punctigera, Strain Tpunct2005C2" /NCGR_SAMPLE_ID=MMETSP1067 /ASSEMBLY_ACC=CAM_ASM_000444 /LENGTH=433 /DNA_ID=CAMNT_0013338965 /DNA_START=79 /DNA_END=1380 /DNA_ORIENTATION=+
MSEPRAPISLPTYDLGDEGKPNHFNAASTREDAAQDAKSLAVGDAAFILRSDRKWAYGTVFEKQEGDNMTLRFLVDKKMNRKTFPEAVWGKYIRVIKVDADELAKLEAEAAKAKAAEEPMKEDEPDEPNDEPNEDAEKDIKTSSKKDSNKEAKKDGSKADIEKMTLILGEFSSEVGSWFSAKFGSKKTKESKPTEASSAENTDSVKSQTEDKDTPTESESKPALEETKGKKKSKSQSGSLFSSLFSKKSKSFEDKKQEDSKTASSAIDEDTSNVTKAGSKDKSEAASVPEPEKPSENPSSQPAPEMDESRDAVEETSSSAAALESASEEKPIEEPKPEPIKLLTTPIQFFKAPTMQEDPGEAALAATSFADYEQNDYGLGQNVTVCENDPSAAATAESLAHQRMYGDLEQQGIVVVEAEEDLARQGIAIVQAE